MADGLAANAPSAISPYFDPLFDINARDSCPTMSRRLPIARFTSMRCSPQFARTAVPAPRSPVMSSTRASDGFPFTVTSRNVAFSFVAHFAVNMPGTLTHGVSIDCSGVTQGFSCGVLVMVLPVRSRYARSSPLPPASAAGLVHAAAMFGSATFPKSVLAGGGTVDRNDAYVITQPVCDAVWQRGTFLKLPPTSFPLGTSIVVPSRMADTSRD